MAKLGTENNPAGMPMDNPPPGFITRIRINRITGVGDWSEN